MGIKMFASENQFTVMIVLRRLPRLIHDFRRRGRLRMPASISIYRYIILIMYLNIRMYI